MGSSISKSKKKSRQSTSSTQTPKRIRKKNSAILPGKPRVTSEIPLPQNPPQWSTSANYIQDTEDQNNLYNPTTTNNYGGPDLYQGQGKGKAPADNQRSARNSGNNIPQNSNVSQPRTSTSYGRPSFSLLRGRKSGQHQREGDDPQPALSISMPIIEPVVSAGNNSYSKDYTFGSPSMEQLPRVYGPKPALETSQLDQHQQNAYLEFRRTTSGAYRAPAPLPPIITQATSLPPPPKISTPPLPSTDAPSFLPSPGSISSPVQEPQRLWRESLRNAAAAEGRNHEIGLTRTSSNNSFTSQSSSTNSSAERGYRKPTSGSNFAATTFSPSSSSAPQMSYGMARQRPNRTNVIHPEGPGETRLSQQQQQRHQAQQQHESSENASILSLPGSRYMGQDRILGSGDDDSAQVSRNASEVSLMGSVFSTAGTGANTPSLVGVNIPNDRYDNQFSSPRQSMSGTQLQPTQHWSQTGSPTSTGEHGQWPDSARRSRALSNTYRTATSSARESISSVSTANYQWMDEQTEDSSIQDVINRDSVRMLFHSPTVSEFGSSIKNYSVGTFAGPNEEHQSQQLLEQQAQQHALLKYFFKGNYNAPLNKQDLGSILDGLWMKDMALEFPLTEIHGVDLNVPTRPRRTRTRRTRTAITRSKSASPTSTTFSGDKKAEQHSSLQSNSSSGTSNPSVSSAGTSVTPPMLDSMPSNCFFHKTDITTSLPFADNTFDYCHVRLVLWGYRLNCFPDLLNELIRVTKKGGWIEFVDMDPCILKATETGTCINEWIKTGLIHSNMDPDLVKTLPRFLKEFCDDTTDAALPNSPLTGQCKSRGSLVFPSQPYGLENLKVTKISLPFGPWGGKVGELWQQTFTAILKGLEPMMVDATRSGLVMDQYHRQCMLEMQQLADAANASSSSGRRSVEGGREQLTSFDQRLCTHKAWYHLINQLVRDASLSTLSTGQSTHSPSSIKDMRSYNNFYIAYAQKADLVELKQQLLFQQLERDVLSPNPKIASSSMFSLASTSTFGTQSRQQQLQSTSPSPCPSPLQGQIQSPVRGEIQSPKLYQASGVELSGNPEQTRRLASTLRERLSSPNLHHRYVSGATVSSEDGNNNDSKAEGDDDKGDSYNSRSRNPYGLIASLTQDALETFNKNNSEQPKLGGPVARSASSSAVPPTPASIAALSIRSNSRNSNRNNSVSGVVTTGTPLVRTPGSVRSASGLSSPLMAANVLRGQGSVPSGLGSPQPGSFESDYFNSVPIQYPSAYHEQQYNHRQQPMNIVERKPSLLSRVHVPENDAAAMASAAAVAGATAAIATGAAVAARLGHSEEAKGRDNGEEGAAEWESDVEETTRSSGFIDGVPLSPTLEPVHFAKESAIEGLELDPEDFTTEDPQVTADTDSKDDDTKESDMLMCLQEDNEDDFEDEMNTLATTTAPDPKGVVGMVPEHQVAAATKEDMSESDILIALQEDNEDDFEEELDTLAAMDTRKEEDVKESDDLMVLQEDNEDDFEEELDTVAAMDTRKEEDVKESDNLMMLQEDNEDDLEEEMDILAESKSENLDDEYEHENDDEKESDILIALVDEDEDNLLPADFLAPTGSSYARVEHADDDSGPKYDEDNDENTIKIINRVSRDGDQESEPEDESQLQMLSVEDDEEVFVMMAPRWTPSGVSTKNHFYEDKSYH
ncbi:hypothetical protein BGZ58_000212 [Dissophora ornata]|nr:hypothetical protein BGZ58_000212 [Dissophora ornata]